MKYIIDIPLEAFGMKVANISPMCEWLVERPIMHPECRRLIRMRRCAECRPFQATVAMLPEPFGYTAQFTFSEYTTATRFELNFLPHAALMLLERMQACRDANEVRVINEIIAAGTTQGGYALCLNPFEEGLIFKVIELG